MVLRHDSRTVNEGLVNRAELEVDSFERMAEFPKMFSRVSGEGPCNIANFSRCSSTWKDDGTCSRCERSSERPHEYSYAGSRPVYI